MTRQNSSAFSVKQFDRESFPALYRCADSASESGQQWYLKWVAINLSLLLVGAIVGAVVFDSVDHKRAAYIITAIVFFGAMGVTILLAARRWERIWYAGRAIAESAKSLTWKFVCGADPFPLELASKEAVERFTKSLHELVEENKQLAASLANFDALGEQVTSLMAGLRMSPIEVRRDVYLAQRINQQREWYANKALSNRKHRNIWFALLVAFQAAAGSAAVFLAIFPMLPWKMTAVFGSLASITVAWGQIKRYQELAQSYGLAAQELSFIAARGQYVDTPSELARFVNDAETAISREHSMWVARRETK